MKKGLLVAILNGSKIAETMKQDELNPSLPCKFVSPNGTVLSVIHLIDWMWYKHVS